MRTNFQSLLITAEKMGLKSLPPQILYSPLLNPIGGESTSGEQKMSPIQDDPIIKSREKEQFPLGKSWNERKAERDRLTCLVPIAIVIIIAVILLIR